ncbi:MAG: hypothetical protein QGI86_21445 [Candidatus Poribacteria bacterium]|jgi:hypothetical protein|nr:hypothetical protein [Candidatus Poribacteria bacterium]MDP6747518.1 hypothetical protein [Candidatus Poribacteria bacterium]MDP6998899.1 hypothetical protein [Candidatus Poribacteria bacterium]
MKANELLAQVKARDAISCHTCEDKIPADEILGFNFKLGELAPRMENVAIGSIICVECQRQDELIKVEPRGPDIKFVPG